MSKTFEIEGREWGETNIIGYIVRTKSLGYTQLVQGVFKDKGELMGIFEGIAEDYFSATSPKSDEPRTADAWEKELEEK